MFIIKDKEGKILEEPASSIQTSKLCQGVYGNVGARQMREASASSDALIATVNAMLAYGDSAAIYLTASGQ